MNEPLTFAPAVAHESAWPKLHAPLSFSGRTVLLATDGSPEAAAATHLSLALAEQCHVTVHALSVIDTRPAPIPPPLDKALAFNNATTAMAMRNVEEEEVRRSIVNVLGRRVEWPVRLALGAPVESIAREAARQHAALVVLGLRPYGKLERALHLETTLEVMRTASCPVLGVPAGMTELPNRVLVAIDFGRASLEAARVARALVAPDGTLVLAYAAPTSFYGPQDGETLIQELGVKACFDNITSQLKADRVSIQRVVLHHERPATISGVLLDYAKEHDIQLIAVGSAHHNVIDRWILGSVSTDLAHEARCALLLMPPDVPCTGPKTHECRECKR
jgi:nucleotide-binding universal stress UspA family protein